MNVQTKLFEAALCIEIGDLTLFISPTLPIQNSEVPSSFSSIYCFGFPLFEEVLLRFSVYLT